MLKEVIESLPELELSSSDRFVLLLMAGKVKESGITAPTTEWLADATGYTPRAIRRSFASLREKGYLELVTHGGGRGIRSEYRIVIRSHPTSTPL